MLKNEFNQNDFSISLIYRFDDKVNNTPEHVNSYMNQPSCGITGTDFGMHSWARPITDEGNGYFLNVGHQRENAIAHGFDGDGIFAKQYKVENGDWKVEPFMANNPADLVTKEYLMRHIERLEKRIEELENK